MFDSGASGRRSVSPPLPASSLSDAQGEAASMFGGEGEGDGEAADDIALDDIPGFGDDDEGSASALFGASELFGSSDLFVASPPPAAPTTSPPAMFGGGNSSSSSSSSAAGGVDHGSRAQDPTSRAPHAAISFAFGGRFVMVPPRASASTATSVFASVSTSSPGDVHVVSVATMLRRGGANGSGGCSAAFDRMDTFGGPLAERSERGVAAALEEYGRGALVAKGDTWASLWFLLRMLWENNGVMPGCRKQGRGGSSSAREGDATAIQQLVDALLSKESSESTPKLSPHPIVPQNRWEGGAGAAAAAAALDDDASSTSTGHQAIMSEMEDHVAHGRFNDAISTAIGAEMWGRALVIALAARGSGSGEGNQNSGEIVFRNTMQDFANRAFTPGSASHMLTRQMAGVGFAKKAERAVGHSAFGHTGGDGSSSGSEQRNEDVVDPALRHWRRNLAALVQLNGQSRSRNDGALASMIQLGNRLSEDCGDVAAAHVCYLAAGRQVEQTSAGHALISLIGGGSATAGCGRYVVHWRHAYATRTQPLYFFSFFLATHSPPFLLSPLFSSLLSLSCSSFITPEAVQATEIFEYAKRRTDPDFNLVTFQSLKLCYAMALADHGLVEEAFQYCSSLIKTVKRTVRFDSIGKRVSGVM